MPPTTHQSAGLRARRKVSRTISIGLHGSEILSSQPRGFFEFMPGVASVSNRGKGGVRLDDIAELILAPDTFRHRRHAATQASIMAVTVEHKWTDIITVADVKTVAATLEEYSGTTGNDASIAELEVLIIPDGIGQFDQFLILDRLESRCGQWLEQIELVSLWCNLTPLRGIT